MLAPGVRNGSMSANGMVRLPSPSHSSAPLKVDEGTALPSRGGGQCNNCRSRCQSEIITKPMSAVGLAGYKTRYQCPRRRQKTASETRRMFRLAFYEGRPILKWRCSLRALHQKRQLSLIHISEPTRLGMISYA